MNSLPRRFNMKTAIKILFLLIVLIGGSVAGFDLVRTYVVADRPDNGMAQQETSPLYAVRIQTQEGSYIVQAELADTPEKAALGLMGRTGLKPDHGMLFLFPEEGNVSFWMRNTLIHLDLIYIAKDGIINHIHPMAAPLDDTQLPSKGGKVIAVLEIAGGQAAAKNIRIGDKVETPLLEGKTE